MRFVRERSHQSPRRDVGATPRLSRRFNGDEAAIIFREIKGARYAEGEVGEGPRGEEERRDLLTEQPRFRQEGWYA